VRLKTLLRLPTYKQSSQRWAGVEFSSTLRNKES